MYAAAGGASLASRQARQRQRKNKTQAAQLKKQQNDLLPKQPQGKQFHGYTETTVKLSRVERNALRPMPQPERRHSTSLLKEPSRARIKESPSVLIPVQNHLAQKDHHQPLTPCTLVQEHPPPLHPSPSIQSQLPQITIPEGENRMERRCSFVRQVEEMEKCQEGGLLDRCHHMCNFEIKDKGWDGNVTYYSEFDRAAFGSLDYPFSECSQGRAAWQERERGRRCSLSEEAHQHRLKQTEAHHRWMKRNRIHDATYGGGSEEDIFSVYHQSAAANALLYVGLGTTAIGSVVFFVGSGDKGFKTLELRLIGPTLIACGLLCCLIRVLLCACPSTCLRRRKKTRLKNTCPHGSNRYPIDRPNERSTTDFVQVEPNTALIGKQKKRVCIAPTRPMPSTSTMDFREDVEKPKIPIITVPEFTDFNSEQAQLSRENTSIELQNLELNFELQSVSSVDSDSFTIETENAKGPSKLSRTRVPVHSANNCEDNETCLSVIVERNDNSECEREKKKESHSGIVLSPLQLGQ